MMIPFLLTMGLCALSSTATAQQLQMDNIIPQEDSVQVMHLANGIRTYIQEHQAPPQCASLRVVLRKSNSQEVQYAIDVRLDSLEQIEEFLAGCRSKIKSPRGGSEEASEPLTVSNPNPSLLGMNSPEEIAIVAVGDFELEQMQRCIEKHFGDVVLSHAKQTPESSSQIHIGFDKALSKVGISLSYPNTCMPIHTYEDLKQTWAVLFLQELFQQRMERCSKGLDEDWVHPRPKFFYPVSGYTFSSEELSENLLSFLLWQVEAVRDNGFFEDEFYATRRNLVNQLQYLAFNATAPDDAFLASYYADQFLLGDRCLKFQNFLDSSATIVQQIQSADLIPYLSSFFLDENRRIKVVYPMPLHDEVLTQERVENMISRVASLAAFYRNSNISEEEETIWSIESIESCPVSSHNESIQLANDREDSSFSLADNANVPFCVKTTLGSDEPFYQLPLTDEEMRFIKSIITTMADKNVFQLAFEKHSLEKKGKKINHVHPMRFIGYILSTSSLKNNLKTIKKSSFKWDAFIDGFSKRMKEEMSKDNVYQHIPGFAKLVGSTPEHVRRYINKKDYVGLVKSLL
jgi:Peptidase M16 inactive domain